MGKIKLSKKTKSILNSIKEGKYVEVADKVDILFLHTQGLVNIRLLSSNDFFGRPELTDKGKMYFYTNPSLDNPSIFDDKKSIITTSISVVVLLLSILSIIITLS